jgi:methionyl-tRNA formyltransferase
MIKKKICILLNNINEYDFEDLLKIYLTKEKFDISVTDKFPRDLQSFDLIIPWSYRKIIRDFNQFNNIVIIHSSELPQGRGWAPIYYSIKEGQSDYVMSCIIATDEVDKGDIIVKASFPILPEYTATFLRKVDREISLLLIKKILDKWTNGKIITSKQQGAGSYRPKRYPNDNEIKTSNILESLLPHLRAVENNNPAFFYYKDIKYLISISPQNEPEFPNKIKIEYPGINEIEYWSKS